MKLFIDNNFWDYLAENNVDLPKFLPLEQFELYITTHGRYEVLQMPSRCVTVKEYALNFIGNIVKEDAIFGFFSKNIPTEHQRVAGFGKGRFANVEENKIRSNLFKKYGSLEKRHEQLILFKQEADIEIATRSFFFPILTFDKKKKGAIYFASKNGGKVIFIDKKQSKGMTVKQVFGGIKERINCYLT